jgi:nucleoside-diphosphate-sugar epimerase
VDVADVVSALAELSVAGVKGESFILSGHKTTVRELVTLAAKHADVKPPWFCIPFWVALLFARPIERFYVRRGKMPLFTPSSLRILRDNCNFSHEKITALTGYAPRPLDETIKAQVEFNRGIENAK